MSQIDFEIDGKNYRADPMDARKQFHVARRIAGSIGSGDIQSALMSLSGQSDEVFDYVIDACLGVVRVEGESGAWEKVIVGDQIMQPYIRESLSVMVQIVAKVTEANVKGFLSALPSGYLADMVGKAMAGKVSN